MKIDDEAVIVGKRRIQNISKHTKQARLVCRDIGNEELVKRQQTRRGCIFHIKQFWFYQL